MTVYVAIRDNQMLEATPVFFAAVLPVKLENCKK